MVSRFLKVTTPTLYPDIWRPDIPPPTRTLPRIRQSLRILEDLGALTEHESDPGRLLLTALGKALLEESIV